MAKVDSFIVLGKMSEDDRDIRLALLPESLINVRKVKAGGHVTVGVDGDTADIIMRMALNENKYGAFLLVFSREQFDEIREELEHPVQELTLTPEQVKELD